LAELNAPTEKVDGENEESCDAEVLGLEQGNG